MAKLCWTFGANELLWLMDYPVVFEWGERRETLSAVNMLASMNLNIGTPVAISNLVITAWSANVKKLSPFVVDSKMFPQMVLSWQPFLASGT